MPSARALIWPLATLLLTGSLLSLASPAPAAAGWEPPVPGGVARSFDLGSDPFEAGRHRGVDLAAPPGAAVRAPCRGRVVVAGRVGTSGGVVSVLCGGWRVSHLPLARIVVRRGDAVDEGAVLGALAPSGAHRGLHLGVRRDGTRFGYVDPLPFLDRTRVPPVVVAPPRRVRLPGRTPRLGPAPRPALRPAPRAAPRPAPGPAPRLGPAPRPAPGPARGPVSGRVTDPTPRPAPPLAARQSAASRPADRRDVAPWPVWVGLALVLGGLGAGSGWARRRGHRAARPRRSRTADVAASE